VADKLLYQQVYDELKARITDGRIAVNDRLPTPAELTQEFSVSTITLKRALDMLEEDGYVVRRPRHGTVVISAAPEKQQPASAKTTTARSVGAVPLLGAVLTAFDDTFGTAMLEAMIQASAGKANLIIKASSGEAKAEGPLIEELLAGGIRGLAFQPSSSAAQTVPAALLGLLGRGFPVVIIDRSFDGIPVSTVCSDNVASARQATEYLFGLGHRGIGFVTSASRVSTIEDRHSGYVAAHAAAGVPHDDRDEFREVYSVTPGADGDPDDDLARLTAFVRERPHLTAYLVTERHIALLLRRACRSLGLDIPGDVSVICYDQPAAWLDDSVFRFTHVAQPQHLMGAAVIGELTGQLSRPGAAAKQVLQAELVEGASTAPPVRTPRSR
jgi:DNA-binding LacI/PurR family transcriptional regulator